MKFVLLERISQSNHNQSSIVCDWTHFHSSALFIDEPQRARCAEPITMLLLCTTDDDDGLTLPLKVGIILMMTPIDTHPPKKLKTPYKRSVGKTEQIMFMGLFISTRFKSERPTCAAPQLMSPPIYTSREHRQRQII